MKNEWTIDALREFARSAHGLSAEGTPVLSVVVPIFNHADYLPQCLGSILSQGLQNIELVCIDDCSTDVRIAQILEVVSSLPGVRCLHNASNRGISESQNTAVAEARGRYIAFVDCDDQLIPGALGRIVDEIAQHDCPDYLFTDRRNIDANDKKLFDAVYKLVASERGIVRDLADRMIASHLKVIRKDSFVRAGGFGNRYSGIQDWELALKIAEFGRFVYVPEVLYAHRLHVASVTSSDSRGQAKKSNLLRRAYLGRESINPGPAQLFRLADLVGRGWYCPEELFDACRRGEACHLDAQGSLSAVEIEFLVDFNSYFDRIYINRVDVASQVVGSLWSPRILRTGPVDETLRVQG